MDTRSEIPEFLTSRRAKLKAADVGLPDYGTRRFAGVRREEALQPLGSWAATPALAEE
jgi:hypothetical protein